jgi:hypothetical protein
MAGKCISLVKGRRIRLTRVNDCGIPVYGEGNQVTSKGFISVAFTANSTDSDEISVQNAAGEVCVFEPSETSFTGYGVEATFCEVDVELFALATGQEVYLDAAGNAIGFTINTKIEREGGFALELWAGSPNADVCDDPNAQGSYGYLLFPFVKGGIVGDFTIENGAATFTISGSTTRDGNGWGVGPYPVLLNNATPSVAAPLPSALDSADHMLMVVTTVAPPEAACGTRPLLDPSGAALTSVAGVVTGLSADFDVTPISTGPVWYDFGDGEWDYVAAPGEASHTYDTAGTYTVKASQNGTQWVTTTVTVTGP